ncbi:MAG TPA: gamma-glutamyltransferase [Allosphingosinicella sp.]|nr:gamma-glutamyltransferase [Allosphingosinicella sp.]
MLNRLGLRPLLIALPLVLASACAPRTAEAPPATASAAAVPGMVSAADPRAAEAGRDILRQGGSAADAALAMMLALTVVEPQSSGIGGGSFLVYNDSASGKVSTYDGREEAPAAASPSYFLGPDGKPREHDEAIPGGLSVGVPGNIRQLELAHERHGKLPRAALFAPAIRLARDGFAITARMRRALDSSRETGALSASGRALFYEANGEPKPVGTIVRNPELAAFLETLAERGPDAFYTGPAAAALVRTVRSSTRNPSIMTEGDLATYDARERPAACGSYRGWRICGMGPPSSGATTVYAILKQLERFDLKGMGPDSVTAWHLIGESSRLAYADREAYLGDPDYVRVPMAGLFDPAYLASRSALISPDRSIPHVTHGFPPGAPRVTAALDTEVSGTSHMVAVDRFGNVASLTSTIESAFGSGLMVNGFYLNNELTDFTFAPEKDGAPVANRVEGGKRPRSSMSPTIVYGPDGKVRIAIGAAGGPTIIAQVAKSLIAVLDWNMSAQDAIALPVIMGVGDRVLLEKGTKLEAMMPALIALGDRASTFPPGFKANAVEWVGGHWAGAADPRSEGVAVGE